MAEWRVFIPLDVLERASGALKADLLDVCELFGINAFRANVASAKVRTDVYVDAGAYIGVKFRNERKLEMKVRQDTCENAFGIELWEKYKVKGAAPAATEPPEEFSKFVLVALKTARKSMSAEVRASLDQSVLPGLQDLLMTGTASAVSVTKMRSKGPASVRGDRGDSAVSCETCLVRVAAPGGGADREWASVCVEAADSLLVEFFLADKSAEWSALWRVMAEYGRGAGGTWGGGEGAAGILVNGYPGFVHSLVHEPPPVSEVSGSESESASREGRAWSQATEARRRCAVIGRLFLRGSQSKSTPPKSESARNRGIAAQQQKQQHPFRTVSTTADGETCDGFCVVA
jgi:hypothetical protein